MNEQMKEYIIRNYSKYHIDGLKNESDMLGLLNILEAHNENLDNLHNVKPNDMFCDIFFGCPDINDNCVYDALISHNIFYQDENSLISDLREFFEDDTDVQAVSDDGLIRYITANCYDTVITKTSDGYVRTLYY